MSIIEISLSMKKLGFILSLVGLICQSFASSVISTQNLPAFPCAEGFGTTTPGGRGGNVITVTNLNPSGPGSFQEAVQTPGKRIVVFNVSGVIKLTNAIIVREPYITIAAQTSPRGIALRGAPLIIATHDVVVRGLRLRVGDDLDGYEAENRDGINISSTLSGQDIYNVVVDHSSVSWAVDENMATWTNRVHDVTIGWSILTEGIRSVDRVSGGRSASGLPYTQSMGMLLGSDGASNITVHHNIFANNDDRNPGLDGVLNAEVINNVIYNWTGGPTVVGDDLTTAHIIKNYYKLGLNSRYNIFHFSDTSNSQTRIYLEDNWRYDPKTDKNGGQYWSQVEGDATIVVKTLIFTPSNVTIQTPSQVYSSVLRYAGAFHPQRDMVDRRTISSIQNNSGKPVYSPLQMGGWPVYNQGVHYKDFDHDGMPDNWELARGLNPNFDDSRQDINRNGYTNIEDYINSFYQEWCPS